MQEIGVVMSLDGPKAFVAVKKQSSCDKCAAGSVCKGLGGDEAAVEALNPVHAKVGDTVKIAFKPYTYLKGALLVYGLPAVLLVIGAVVGKEYLSGFFPSSDPEMVSAITGFGFFGFGFAALKIILSGLDEKKEYQPVIEEILNIS